MKVIRIITVVLLILACFGLTYYSNNTALNATHDLNQERYLRMVCEENLNNVHQEIKSLKSSLERAGKKIQTMESKVEQVEALNSDLNARLKQSDKINKTLENQMAEMKKTIAQQKNSDIEANP